MNARSGGMIWLSIRTAEGIFFAGYTNDGLACLDFPSNERYPAPTENLPPRIVDWHNTVEQAVCRVLEGKPVNRLPPLDLAGHTEFRKNVWKVLREISPGSTKSYGEVARLLGKPYAFRAVGSACGANPIPVLIPCHRVLAAGGGLGGFSGGLSWKVKLLEREGIAVKQR